MKVLPIILLGGLSGVTSSQEQADSQVPLSDQPIIVTGELRNLIRGLSGAASSWESREPHVEDYLTQNREELDSLRIRIGVFRNN